MTHNEAFYNYHNWCEQQLADYEQQQDLAELEEEEEEPDWLTDPNNVMSRYHY